MTGERYQLKISVDPEALRRQSQRALQRIIDCARVSSAGLAVVTSDAYAAPPDFMSLDTAANESLSLEDARVAAEAWHVRNAFRDSVEVVASALEEARRICAATAIGSGRTLKAREIDSLINGQSGKFHRLGIPDRLDYLRERYGLDPQLKAQFLALNRTRNCLVHRNGVVGPRDVDATGEMAVEWRSVRPVVISPSGERELTLPFTIEEEDSSVAVKVVDVSKRFELGKRVELSPGDLQGCLLTMLLFADSLAVATRKYVNSELARQRALGTGAPEA